MASSVDDPELTELKHMVMSFRVSELQVLLGSAGRNKSGRKHDLLSRALQLLKNGCNSQIQVRVRELYQRRFPRSRLITPTFNLSKDKLGMEFEDSKSKRNHFVKPSKPPIHPDVKFKKLPFYDVVSDVIKPSSLISRPNRESNRTDFTFTLSEEQTRVIRESMAKDPVKRYQVQVQLRFCLLETTCEQKDFLPPNLAVQVNRQLAPLPSFVPPSKAGVEAKRANRPIDITMCCHLCDVSPNRLEVTWMSDHGKNYALSVDVVRPLSSETLLQRLRRKGVRSSGHSQALISEKLSRDLDSEIATTSLKVSLLCPLGKMRMTIPARPITCTHMQCFDAMLFLQMNERKPTWTCPVCDKPTEFSSLFIDGLFVDILNETASEEVIFLDNGRWEPYKAKTECLSLCTPSKRTDTIEDLTRQESLNYVNPKKRLDDSAYGAVRKHPRSDFQGDYIVEDAWFRICGSKVTGKTSSDKARCSALDLSNSPKSSPSTNNGTKRKEVVVIDLTGDSSDEESQTSSPIQRKDADKDMDEIHSLSSTSPYRSDNSVHRDDLAAPTPKRRRSPKDDNPWETSRDTSFSGISSNALGTSSTSPRPSDFSSDMAGQIAHSLASVYPATGTRSDASSLSMYPPFSNFDPYPLDFSHMYFLNAGLDPLRRMPGDRSARSSPYLNQQSHLTSSSDHLQRTLYQSPYYFPDGTDVIPID